MSTREYIFLNYAVNFIFSAVQTVFTKIRVQGWNSINKPGIEDICHFIDRTEHSI